MTNCRFAAIATLGVVVASATGSPALAQATTAATSAAGAAANSSASTLEAQKTAFLAMPEPDRKAAQDALVWLGLYNGVVDGAFGKRTLDSILAYQAGVKAPRDGTVSGPELAAL